MLQRLDKILAGSGLLTRSQAKAALRADRVRVNGAAVRDGAEKADPERDCVTLDGSPIAEGRVVLMLNKPAGYVTSTRDPRDPTVMELLPQQYRRRVSPVGRLDKDTEGLLLLTDDGDLAHRLISPRHRVDKVYYARHEGQGTAADVEAFAAGLTLADGTRCLPAKLEVLGPGESLVIVCEGKYHQVRRMLASRGMPVTYLERQAEGGLTLGNLPRGKVRRLTEAECRLLAPEKAGGAELGNFLEKPGFQPGPDGEKP